VSGSLFDDRRLGRIKRQALSDDEAAAVVEDIRWLMDVNSELNTRHTAIFKAAEAVARAFTAEAEDWNDGEFALWRKDDLVNAIVNLRTVMGA